MGLSRLNGQSRQKHRFGAVKPASMLLALMLCATPATAEEPVVAFNGHSSTITDEFEIEGPWLLDWHIGSEFPGSFGLEISLIDGAMVQHHGVVLKTRYVGYGTKLFRDSGRFRFRVTSSLADWSLNVIKLSKEEADQMIPRREHQRKKE